MKETKEQQYKEIIQGIELRRGEGTKNGVKGHLCCADEKENLSSRMFSRPGKIEEIRLQKDCGEGGEKVSQLVRS